MSKSSFTFSAQQQKAMSLTKQNMLISAGAGSGKTAVLVERLVQLITVKNIELDKLLVLTFTNAGAAEFKTRIKKRLESIPSHAHKAYAIDGADITTFDSFALKIVRKYGYLAGLDPDIKNLDGALAKVLFRRAFNAVMAPLYEKPTRAVQNYAKRFLLKDDAALLNTLYSIESEANLALNPAEFINNYVDHYYSKKQFERLYDDFTRLVISKLRDIASNAKKLEDPLHLKRYEPFLSEYSNVLTYEAYLANTVLQEKPRTPNHSYAEFADDEYFSEKNKQLFDELTEFRKTGDKKAMYTTFLENREHAVFLIDLYKKIKAQVEAFKLAKNTFTFSDIAHSAFSLVQLPAVQDELRNQYEYILIDEYQDTSDIQEAFINTFANNNVYMVGDIKQSIYAFRNANSDIFRNKYQKFAKKDGGVLVDLNDNYRSRHTVLAAINGILSDLMSDKIGGANYKNDHVIGYANKVYDANEVAGQRQGLKVLAYTIPEETEASKFTRKTTTQEYEAEIIIADIKAKMASGFQVFDNENKVLRKITYKDFTILATRGTHFDDIERRFIAEGIPLYQDRDEKLQDDKVVIALNAMLTIFDAYTKETQPTSYEFRFAVASFLRSFINNYTDQQLLDLMGNKNRDYSSDLTLAKIAKLATELKEAPIVLIVHKLIAEFNFYGAINRIGNIQQNTFKLMSKVQEIENLAKLNFTMSELLLYFKEALDLDLKTQIVRPKISEDSVNIMTIHNSKGLEFPVVYYIDLEQDFYLMEKREQHRASDKVYGLILPSPNKAPTLHTILAEARMNENMLSERMRILYVALTRAREKMIVIQRAKAKDEVIVPLRDARNFRTVLLNAPLYVQAIEEIPLGAVKASPQLAIPTYMGKETITQKILPSHFKTSPILITPQAPVVVSQYILARGTLLHKYIELYDFKTRKLDYIPNRDDREHIKKLFALPLFVPASETNVYREYAFLGADDKTYVIDMFILGAREITLLDFKLVNLDHAQYDVQVRNYANYLEKVFKRPVNAYLVSIMNLDYRRVLLNEQN